MSLRLRIHRMLHWEYWPMWMIYGPIIPVWLYYALRTRSLFFFNTSNPTFKNGGMAMESKKDIYNLIPEQFIPRTILVETSDHSRAVLNKISRAGIRFPFIAKPDIGMKAFAVAVIHNEEELWEYASKLEGPYLIQHLIKYPKEIGIFYYRFPKEEKGHISGMVEKEFLTVTGDGVNSIRTIVQNESRGAMRMKALQKLHGDRLDAVLMLGEKFILVPYGSHTRGARFFDVTNELNENLLQTIDKICRKVPGFYYGRLDVRYNTMEELSVGKNFSIIEINGAGSEPTHIYDTRHSIFYAWREIIRHWKILFRISKLNNARGYSYLSFAAGWKMIFENNRLEERLKSI